MLSMVFAAKIVRGYNSLLFTMKTLMPKCQHAGDRMQFLWASFVSPESLLPVPYSPSWWRRERLNSRPPTPSRIISWGLARDNRLWMPLESQHPAQNSIQGLSTQQRTLPRDTTEDGVRQRVPTFDKGKWNVRKSIANLTLRLWHGRKDWLAP